MKSNKTTPRNRRFTILAMAVAMAFGQNAVAAPGGAVFIKGAGTVTTPTAGTTQVDITAADPSRAVRTALIDWKGGFNVANGETVNFVNSLASPARLAVINVDNTGTRSAIDGAITSSTGTRATSVYLVNPTGVHIGATANINVGGSFMAAQGSILTETCTGPGVCTPIVIADGTNVQINLTSANTGNGVAVNPSATVKVATNDLNAMYSLGASASNVYLPYLKTVSPSGLQLPAGNVTFTVAPGLVTAGDSSTATVANSLSTAQYNLPDGSVLDIHGITGLGNTVFNFQGKGSGTVTDVRLYAPGSSDIAKFSFMGGANVADPIATGENLTFSNITLDSTVSASGGTASVDTSNYTGTVSVDTIVGIGNGPGTNQQFQAGAGRFMPINTAGTATTLNLSGTANLSLVQGLGGAPVVDGTGKVLTGLDRDGRLTITGTPQTSMLLSLLPVNAQTTQLRDLDVSGVSSLAISKSGSATTASVNMVNSSLSAVSLSLPDFGTNTLSLDSTSLTGTGSGGFTLKAKDVSLANGSSLSSGGALTLNANGGNLSVIDTTVNATGAFTATSTGSTTLGTATISSNSTSSITAGTDLVWGTTSVTSNGALTMASTAGRIVDSGRSNLTSNTSSVLIQAASNAVPTSNTGRTTTCVAGVCTFDGVTTVGQISLNGTTVNSGGTFNILGTSAHTTNMTATAGKTGVGNIGFSLSDALQLVGGSLNHGGSSGIFNVFGGTLESSTVVNNGARNLTMRGTSGYADIRGDINATTGSVTMTGNTTLTFADATLTGDRATVTMTANTGVALVSNSHVDLTTGRLVLSATTGDVTLDSTSIAAQPATTNVAPAPAQISITAGSGKDINILNGSSISWTPLDYLDGSTGYRLATQPAKGQVLVSGNLNTSNNATVFADLASQATGTVTDDGTHQDPYGTVTPFANGTVSGNPYIRFAATNVKVSGSTVMAGAS